MVPIKTKEHLVYFMQCGMLRLSRYDLHFVQNLNVLATSKKTITTNQIVLFDKIVDKYSRQLQKHGLTKTKIEGLVWENEIVPSDSKYTEAYITIKDNTIIFKSPFSKKFLEKFSNHDYNSFKWYRETKQYESEYSTQSLKYLITLAKQFYPKINYCEVTEHLINSVEKFNAKYWEPTLICLNGRYIIAAINEALYNATAEIELSSNPECLSLLAAHGVKVDESIVDNNPLLKFASEYSTIIDYADADNFINYLHAVKCDSVFVSGLVLSQQYKKDLITKIKEANIQVDEKSNILLLERLKEKKNPIILYMMERTLLNVPALFKKIVRITNGLPIHIK